ncbi:hypothetical protein VP01_83g9 [Puccinia sorghi]|uniref:Uncharacterized protein n=1 Tax=Puccinia sorghi TaxID=27349 RepID=A0A0L6U9K1_9BASI|nr:hypothetical protein VP01_83g9 [Puccinia sorghi]
MTIRSDCRHSARLSALIFDRKVKLVWGWERLSFVQLTALHSHNCQQHFTARIAVMGAIRELDPLKIKFQALVNELEPTGNPDFPL